MTTEADRESRILMACATARQLLREIEGAALAEVGAHGNGRQLSSFDVARSGIETALLQVRRVMVRAAGEDSIATVSMPAPPLRRG